MAFILRVSGGKSNPENPEFLALDQCFVLGAFVPTLAASRFGLRVRQAGKC